MSIFRKNKTNKKIASLENDFQDNFWCWEKDSNFRRLLPTDLQSVVFDRFTIPADTKNVFGATFRIRTEGLLFTKQLL